MRTRICLNFDLVMSRLLVLGVAFLMFACKAVEPEAPQSYMEGLSFNVALSEEEDGMDTKSLLPETAAFESKISSIAFGVYQDGTIVDRQYYSGSLSGLRFTVEKGKAYNIYVVGNMGDVKMMFPSSESEISSFEYDIPAYTGGGSSVSELGIPLCGSGSYSASAGSPGTISLRRLLAKVTANISCAWTGAQISTVKVYNLNRKLTPFSASGSKASSASDMLPVQEYSSGTNTSSGSFVFYVPENRQGTIAGITNSSSKSPDYNATVNERQALLTYIETRVNGSGDISGYIDYRSYLGSNSTTNFDIIGNKGYVWSLTYSQDGIQEADWKHGNNLTWYGYRYELSKSSMTLNVGSSDTFSVYRYTDTYTGGSLVSTGTVPETLPRSSYSYVSQSTSVASVAASGASAVAVNGVAYGNTSVRVTISADSYVLDLPVSVRDVYQVTISPKSATLMVGSQQSFTATLTKNGTVVTGLTAADFSWSSSDTSKATVNASGQITGVATGTVTVTVTYTPSASGQVPVSDTATITVIPAGGGGMDTGWDGGGEEIEL